MDEDKFFISDKALKGLQSGIARTKGSISGYLFGFINELQFYIHGYSANTSDSIQRKWEEKFDDAISCLPGGLQVCGLFFRTPQANLTKVMKPLFQTLLPPCSVLQECFAMEKILILIADQTVQSLNYYWFSFEKQDMWPAVATMIDDTRFSKLFTLFRLQGSLSVGFEHHAGQTNDLLSEIQRLEDQIQGKTAAFFIVNYQIAPLTENSQSEAHSVTVSEMLQSVIESCGESKAKRQCGPVIGSEQCPVDVSLCFTTTGQTASESNISCAPIIHHEHKQFKYTRLEVPIDVLTYACSSSPLTSLPALFVEAAVRQLHAVSCCMIKHSQDLNYVAPKPLHFRLNVLDHLVTAVIPESFTDSKLESFRSSLHSQFLVPVDRPVFRKANALTFTGSKACNGGCLLDVHLGLNPSGVSGGKSYMVTGHYAYHHYMQDKIDDNGWGCAYRSLQTIVSWFRLQGYTDKSVPTHTEIQQALAAVGDKQPSFVGSKRWIGSIEVSNVLDQLYGIVSIILHVTSGNEMALKARELARHFEAEGTPVMIGGGVLAHTILGVDWNEATGDVKFLILDPHYTGAEDLKFIQDKGWCGWKTPDFWDKNAYYNMCMPQRPVTF